jgi:PhzF family phenazine biosynthesis protein
MDIYQVDAFTEKPFYGNPAAVCLMEGPANESWMQQVAQEMNLSETAFLFPQDDGFNLRWFTPALEVRLCGHATLASAHILWEQSITEREKPAHFYTKSGLLRAFSRGAYIELDFPLRKGEAAPVPPLLERALGIAPIAVERCDDDYLVEIGSEAHVRSLRPDFSLLLEVDAMGLMVTAKASTAGYDFVSRYFTPKEGINEDPVTGSAHCALGPYWRNRLGRDELMAFQASSRGGIVKVRVGNDRVFLLGQAVTVLKGMLLC